MRHGMVNRKLGRTTSHRLAMFRNQLTSLIQNERIVTTEVYAKANPEMKRLAVEAAAARTLGPSRYDQASQQDLITWLRQAI